MKTQTLYKRLSLPLLLLLLTVIFATGIGVTPARSASLIGSQSGVIAEKAENTRVQPQLLLKWCEPGQPPPVCKPPNSLAPRDVYLRYQRYLQQQREQQQRELQQQRERQQRELQQQPTVEPSP